jgi:toxin ParE1/3/4
LRIRWSPKAGKDLENIETYISQDSTIAAIRTVVDIVYSMEQLKDFPALGRAGRVVGIRELLIAGTPYIVPYRVKENVIEILRVFHTSRKLQGK